MSHGWIRLTLDEAKSVVYTHKVPEPAKGRCRVVHACAINDALKEMEHQPPKYKLKTPSEVNRLIAMADMVVQFDAESMYDQFHLEKAVSEYFAFKTRSDEIAALAHMPMGLTHACGVAQSLSILVATFVIDDQYILVYLIIHLDNYCYIFVCKNRYTCPPNALKNCVLFTINTFLKRTLRVDLQLNELSREEIVQWGFKSPDEQWNLIQQMSPRQFTFLGTDYDLDARTKTASKKSWDKLESVMNCIYPNGQLNPATTPRHLAMVVGTLGYIARIAEIKHVFYTLHKNLAVLAYATWAYPQGWDIPIPQLAYMFAEIPLLYNMVKTRRISEIYPTTIPHAETLTVITDASHIGWGAIICTPSNDSWTIDVQSDWWPQIGGAPDPIYESSVVAEPMAVTNCLKKINVPPSIKHVIIVTDHSPLVSAGKSKQARCYTYFQTLKWLEAQHFTYTLLFIPGIINPADEPSRNPNINYTDTAKAIEIASAAGMGSAKALLFPNKDVIPSVLAFPDAVPANLSLLLSSQR